MGEPEAPVDNSLLAKLRAERQALTEKREIDKPLPGYSELVGKFRAIDYEKIEEIQERAKKAAPNIGSRAYLNGAADILAEMCTGIFVQNGQGLVPLNEKLGLGDEPLRFDPRLAEAFGVDGSSARSVIHSFFAVDEPETGNDVVMMDFADVLVGWVKRGRDQDDQDF